MGGGHGALGADAQLQGAVPQPPLPPRRGAAHALRLQLGGAAFRRRRVCRRDVVELPFQRRQLLVCSKSTLPLASATASAFCCDPASACLCSHMQMPCVQRGVFAKQLESLHLQRCSTSATSVCAPKARKLLPVPLRHKFAAVIPILASFWAGLQQQASVNITRSAQWCNDTRQRIWYQKRYS